MVRTSFLYPFGLQNQPRRSEAPRAGFPKSTRMYTSLSTPPLPGTEVEPHHRLTYRRVPAKGYCLQPRFQKHSDTAMHSEKKRRSYCLPTPESSLPIARRTGHLARIALHYCCTSMFLRLMHPQPRLKADCSRVVASCPPRTSQPTSPAGVTHVLLLARALTDAKPAKALIISSLCAK